MTKINTNSENNATRSVKVADLLDFKTNKGLE